tara:strand:+ start:2140 stop:2373 length:234 start_codon:yes stop_codon:yes gene_type:complete
METDMLGDIKHGEWQIKNVKKHLIGFKLTEAIQDNGVLGLVFKKGNIQRVAWVLSDDEGNGGGTLEMCDSEGKNLGW